MTTVAISWFPKQRDICIPPPCCLPSFLSSSLSPSPFSLFTHLNQMDSSSPEWGYLASNPQSQTPFHHSQKVRQSHVVWYHTCLPTTLVARDRKRIIKLVNFELFLQQQVYLLSVVPVCGAYTINHDRCLHGWTCSVIDKKLSIVRCYSEFCVR